jgi:hypothetical protein
MSNLNMILSTPSGIGWANGKTVEKIEKASLPEYTPEQLVGRETGTKSEFRIFRHPNGEFVGKPFADSFGYILPQKAWDIVHEGLAGTRFEIQRAGLFKNGTVWFFSASLVEFDEVTRAGHKTYLNASGSLAGLFSPQWDIGDLRITCLNALILSRMLGQKLGHVKQTKNSEEKLPAVVESIEKSRGMIAIFNKVMSELESRKVSRDVARNVLAGEIARNGGEFASASLKKDGSTRESRALNDLEHRLVLFERGAGNKGETRADVANAVTEHLTRGGRGEGSTKDPLLAIESSEFGGNARRKAEFLASISTEAGWRTMADEGKAALAAI